MPGAIFKPVTAELLEDCTTPHRGGEPLTPPCSLTGLGQNRTSTASNPPTQCAVPAVKNETIGTNNAQSENLGSHESGVTNSTITITNHMTGKELIKLILEVTLGHAHQEHIIKMPQTVPMPGECTQLQITSAVIVTPVGPGAAAVGYYFTMMMMNMRQMGFSQPQVTAAMRAARYNPNLALEYLLNGFPANGEGASTVTALEDACSAQASRVQPASTAAIPKDTASKDTTMPKDTTPAGHTTLMQAASTHTGAPITKIAPAMKDTTRTRGDHSRFRGIARSFMRDMLQANADAEAASARRPPIDPLKYSKKSLEKQ